MDPKDFEKFEKALIQAADIHMKMESFANEQEEHIQYLIKGIKPVIEQSYEGTSYGQRYTHAMTQALVASKMLKQAFMTLASCADLDSILQAQIEKTLHDKGYDDEE